MKKAVLSDMNTSMNVVGSIVIIALLAAIAYVALAPQTVAPEHASGNSAKLNIDEICQGALAYTTFPDGASANAFVQDCKDGKHPEVIEQYKRDHGMSADAAI